MSQSRAKEPDTFLTTLPDPAWVECPQCGKAARVVRKPHKYRMRADATLSCGHCCYQNDDASAYRAVHSEHVVISPWRPRCGKCGGNKIEYSSASVVRHGAKITARCRCMGCGHTNEFPASGVGHPVGDGNDHWFGLPLVLRVDMGRHLVWAYNSHHIDLLESYLKADLRERSLHAHYMTMAARLPRWMKAAGNRKSVLRALGKLRAIAKRQGIT